MRPKTFFEVYGKSGFADCKEKIIRECNTITVKRIKDERKEKENGQNRESKMPVLRE